MSQHLNEQTIQQANTEFLKALRYLDYGKVSQAEECLKQAIHLAKLVNDHITFIRAAICYGEMLWHAEKYDASDHWLQLALDRSTALQLEMGDLLNVEVGRAQSLLKNRRRSS
ncbi:MULTISPECIES: hypothetical protein [Lysinibacillus]|uniref:hypothetical protein n=1 Tax=Lysinibacillus TaxID=400634 RepID=UPI0003144983|nr:hypothetical protein [Lysinibacillus boronitolerans]